MENSIDQAGHNYYSNLNRLLRYFLRRQPGYAFACFKQKQITVTINQQLNDLLAESDIKLAEIYLDKHSDLTFVAQLRKFGEADALIINNLDYIIDDESKESDFLLEINFAREQLIALNKPLLFWVNLQSAARISNRASDLYSQRSINTLYFDDITVESKPADVSNEFYNTQVSDPEYNETISLKILLLKKQLLDAEQNNYPKAGIAKSIVIPLAKAYADIGLLQESFQLINDYNHWINRGQADNLYSLGVIYTKGKKYDDAIGLLKRAYDIAEQNNELKMLSDIAFQLGDLFTETGNLDKALNFFDKCIDLLSEMLHSNADNTENKLQLGMAFSRKGRLKSDLGNLEKALKFFEQYVELSKELYEAYPQNVGFKNGLAVSYANMGVFSKNHLHDKAKARKCFIQAEKLWEELVKAAPGFAIFEQYLDRVRGDLEGL